MAWVTLSAEARVRSSRRSCPKRPTRATGCACRWCPAVLGVEDPSSLGKPQRSDEVVEQHGVQILIDRFSAPYLFGAELDYPESLRGPGTSSTTRTPARAAAAGSPSRPDPRAGGQPPKSVT